MKVRDIPIDHIVTGKNVRLERDPELAELVASIAEHGLIHPILVKHRTLKEFEIIAGHRRLAALRQLGAETVPCIVNDDIPDGSRIVIQIVENAQRKQMTAVEYVEAFETIRAAEPRMSYARLGRLIGRSGSWVKHQYEAVELGGVLVSEGVVKKREATGLTAGQIIGRAQKHGITVKGPRQTDTISVAAINSTTLNVRCGSTTVVARVLEMIDGLRAAIRREEEESA